MLFSDLVNNVYTLTNRPDRVNETTLAVAAAILFCHHTDYYYKDLVEMPISFPNLAYLQQIPLQTFPNFRSLKYIRKYYPGTGPNNPPAQDQSPNNLPPLYGMYYDPGANLPDGRFFEIITPDNVVDSYRINKIDVAYVAGQVIQIRSGDYFQYLLAGYYAHPTIVTTGGGTTNSWIAVENPYAIIYKAAATVFKTIGYDEQNATYQQLMQEELIALQMSNITATGE